MKEALDHPAMRHARLRPLLGQEVDPGWQRRKRREIVAQTEGAEQPSGRPIRTVKSGGLIGQVWRERFRPEDEEGGPFRSRGIWMRIHGEDGLVASASFTEWRSDDFLSDMDDFLYWADVSSQQGHEFSVAISEQWADVPPFDYGNLAIFDELIFVPGRDPGSRRWPMLTHMVEVEFRHRASALFLKAFPLEYRSQKGSVGFEQGFARRQKAMIAHYRKNLSVEPIPGSAGVEGWMWKTIGRCPHPMALR